MGLVFPNRVGLAAGFDKNARCIDALGSLGFGFIEVGTVTPRPQPGQPQPRLFRLPSARALINRMGFPNEGADAVAARLARRKFDGVLGINIGKNADTPLHRAIDDYVSCYRTLAMHADYVAINVSSPNTQDLRRLQQVEHLQPILEALMHEGRELAKARGRRIPLLAKISPDLSQEEVEQVAQLLTDLGVDGVIATNTTVGRPDAGHGPAADPLLAEQGGLSGAPLLALSLRTIRTLRSVSQGRLVIVGAGGIASSADALLVLDAGADLLQIYTGLIYRGPALLDEVRKAALAR